VTTKALRRVRVTATDFFGGSGQPEIKLQRPASEPHTAPEQKLLQSANRNRASADPGFGGHHVGLD
jgi:hypothetical protein